MIRRYPQKIQRLLIGIIFAWALFFGSKSHLVQAESTSLNITDGEYRFFLPIVAKPDTFDDFNQPIWGHNKEPDSHEVMLFRRQFVLDDIAQDVHLSIFADTRYEIWIDGVWVGRGPARFSQIYREYDRYYWKALSSGEHLIAILVQWAPNTRRSESSTPLLRVSMDATVNGSHQMILRTQPGWKTLKSVAWKAHADQVHSWNLIGPTELLDMREFPQDWMMPGFDDTSWALSVVRNSYRQDYQVSYRYQNEISPLVENNVFLYQPDGQFAQDREYAVRSIKFLENEPASIAIFDRGQISPESVVVEIPAETSSYELLFDVAEQIPFQIEMLIGDAVMSPNSVTLDQDHFAWRALGPQRPDVYFASASVLPGQHRLTISQIPLDGITLALPTDGISWYQLPFDQGVNAGRRLLLTDYVSEPDSVYIHPGTALAATFVDPPAYLVLDLGRTVHGRLMADMVGPSGTIVDIGWDERLYNNARPLPFPGSFYPYWNQVDSWILDGQKRSIATLDARAGRYILIAVWGTEPVYLGNIRVLEERYPLVQTGSFTSGDPVLDAIWQIGVDTLRPTMTDGYSDPWRERGQWWGDAYVEIRANQVAFGDLDLMRRGLRLMADGFDNGQPTGLAPNGTGVRMLDYGMLWLHSLYDYACWSDDWKLVRELYPTVRTFVEYLDTKTDPSTGLIDLPVGPWTQTAYIDTYGYQSRFGQSTALNSMYYHTLLVGADLAAGLGDTYQSYFWRTDAEAVKQMINSTLYSVDEHRYITSIRDGQVIPPSAYAQAWPLAYGVVPADDEQAVADALLQLLPDDPATAKFGVYAMNWVLAGLGQADRVDDALDVIRLFFGYMLDAGATTWWERFDADQYYSQSLSHGWGSSPTWFLSTYVLGVQRTGPNTWELKPGFESVEKVSGSFPLQDGILEVLWHNQDCAHASITLTVPPKSSGNVTLPWNDALITLDGEIIFEKGYSYSNAVSASQTEVDVFINGGYHNLTIEKPCSP